MKFFKNRRIKILRISIALFILAIELNFWVIRTTENQLYSTIDEIPYNEYGLVLGTSKMGKFGLNPYFKNRMDATLALYKAGKIEKIIVSGDNHIKTYNETQDMADYLMEHGIPSSAIIQDYAGFRTLDSVVRAQKVFKCDQITIISQKFHNQRALFIANQYKINAIAFNASDTKSTGNYTHIREFVAKCWVFADLYIFHTQPKYL